ncbi:MAG: hypothetical protein GWN14_11710 [candidate division Zixibacteria bacterium]|nr:hypothetical protein [Gammaproteobacteria bacterium]NIX56557.1 hypothetical protein [candidate division Zixibacteria bacterium]
MTFPRAVGQIPIYYNHKNTGRPPDNDDYYTSKYLDLPSSPLYPFGYGLSYTSFDYSAPQLSAAKISKDDTLTVNVEVTNSGNRSGDEVIQLYVRDEVGSVTRPVKQLRGFQRVSLSPGERKLITFSITAEDLAFYDLNMNKVVEPGTFRVFVGTSSQDVTEAGFEVIEE